MSQSRPSNKQLMRNIIELVSATTLPENYDAIVQTFCLWCRKKNENQSQTLHELINNKHFISSIIKHFATFNTQIIDAKRASHHPANYTFETFPQLANSANKSTPIVDTEHRCNLCLCILVNLSETDYFIQNGGQIRSIFNRSITNLFSLISSILSHCKLYRLNLSNKLFRFLQRMLPPINSSKSKSFCAQFDVPMIIERCCEFMIYRVHIDGDGYIDETKDNYNNLYGIQASLAPFIDSVISIVTYFISSKWHKQYVFQHLQITPCIVTVCCRLCHELQSAFNLEPYNNITSMFGQPEGFQSVLQEMNNRLYNNEFEGHRVVIDACMEYLYYYALEKDIKRVNIPVVNGGTESFESCWHDYQYVVALLRWVTNNDILGLYLDTIASKLGYDVQVREDVEGKNKKELTCHKVYSVNKMNCFYSKCKKSLDMKQKSKLKKCRQCESAFYCSKQCQKRDWKTHKEICNQSKDGTKGNNDELICFNVDCPNTTDLRRCTGCYDVFYCSVKCQTQHWKQHKTYCKTKRRKNTNV
eukprot:141578_1